MTFVNPTLPNDGESADAVDISGPFLALLAVFNGHIGADNLEPGTIAASLSAGDISTALLAALAVTTAKINDGAITPIKVAPPVIVTTATSNVLTPILSSRDFIVTALDENAAIAVPTGTPYDGQTLTFRFKDDGTARALTPNAIYRGVGVTLPTTTVAGKEQYWSMKYNLPAVKWDVLSIARLG